MQMRDILGTVDFPHDFDLDLLPVFSHLSMILVMTLSPDSSSIGLGCFTVCTGITMSVASILGFSIHSSHGAGCVFTVWVALLDGSDGFLVSVLEGLVALFDRAPFTAHVSEVADLEVVGAWRPFGLLRGPWQQQSARSAHPPWKVGLPGFYSSNLQNVDRSTSIAGR
jgi:hypothetical protein